MRLDSGALPQAPRGRRAAQCRLGPVVSVWPGGSGSGHAHAPVPQSWLRSCWTDGWWWLPRSCRLKWSFCEQACLPGGGEESQGLRLAGVALQAVGPWRVPLGTAVRVPDALVTGASLLSLLVWGPMARFSRACTAQHAALCSPLWCYPWRLGDGLCQPRISRGPHSGRPRVTWGLWLLGPWLLLASILPSDHLAFSQVAGPSPGFWCVPTLCTSCCITVCP